MIKFMQRANWTYIILVHTSNSYGTKTSAIARELLKVRLIVTVMWPEC